MRAIGVLAVSAALALGASVAPTGMAQAQGLLRMSPTADSSAQVGSPKVASPKYDDIKLQTGTALPPKSGAFVFFDRPWPAARRTQKRSPPSGMRRASGETWSVTFLGGSVTRVNVDVRGAAVSQY